MKKLFIIVVTVLFVSCDNDAVNNCIQASGNVIVKEFFVTDFTKIIVNRDIELVLKEGPINEVLVETGENLLNDISVTVVDNELILINNNTCNFVRDYNLTKVYVTAPNITVLKSSTQFKITSDGVLNYPSLNILSENYSDSSTIAVGQVELNLNSTQVNIVGNNLTSFKLYGLTKKLIVSFYSGDGVFDGSNLISDEVKVYHRGSNDITVNPTLRLEGELVGMGDLIAVNKPLDIAVSVLYKGRLIFR
jgi:hypothetical protein